MPEEVLLIGNGINNITANKSWENLLKLLHSRYFDSKVSFDSIKQKPFPLVYEQIVMWQLKQKNHEVEKELKQIIADEVMSMPPNKVHKKIASGKWKHIITANYEFNLMNGGPVDKLKNQGTVKEKMYSIFRNFKVGDQTHWHLHGDAQNIDTINLGYEHYCGQLQRMREYVTTAYTYGKSGRTGKFALPLLMRSYLNSSKNLSWIDFFFKAHTTIKIIGLRLNLEEIDLWWLLTYRAKIMYGAKKQFKPPVANRIIYYVPKQYCVDARGKFLPDYCNKKDLLERMHVKVKELDIPHGEKFYYAALR